jgi:hypothetical protein
MIQQSSRIAHGIVVIAMAKGNEQYIFLYDDAGRADALRTLGRYAANPELSFTWYDAAVISQRIQNTNER